MTSLLEVAVPARLGRPFRWLVASTWVSNLGDGVALAAGPLLVASQTREPFLVALAALFTYLPQLLFGLHAGAIADRLERRRLVAVADACRVVVIAILVGSLVTGTVSIALVLAAMFLLGTGEAFADTASNTLTPMLVRSRDLGTANSRLMGGFVLANQLVGPPVGAFLFGVGRVWPFAGQLVCVALGVVLVLRVQVPGTPLRTEVPGKIRADIVEGVRWVARHAAVRTLVLTILIFNVTFGAAWSVLVLYAQDRLHLGSVGFGLLTTAIAVGGLAGMASYDWLAAHLSLGVIMRAGLVIETLTHLLLAVTTVPVVALAVMLVFGAHAFVWGTTSQAVRQRAVPMEMQGRVGSVNRLASNGGIVAGSLLGGVIASQWGVTGPFWFGFGGSAVFLVLLWRALLHIAHAEPPQNR